ncbi:hypothetical protein S83_028867, partial [Arachis hypogaea]
TETTTRYTKEFFKNCSPNMSVVVCRSDRKRIITRYGGELKYEIVLIDLCDNCIKVKIKTRGKRIWIPSVEVEKLLAFYNFRSMVNVCLMYVTDGIFFMPPLDKRNNPIYMNFNESHYVKDIIGISLLKVIQDKLGLNYFDGLDDVASGIEDNGMHENLERPEIQRIVKICSKARAIQNRSKSKKRRNVSYSTSLQEIDQ